MTKTAVSAKIAVLDIQRMLPRDPQLLKDEATVCAEWRDLFSKLQDTLRPINEELTKLQSELQTKAKEFEALQKSNVASRETLQKRYEEIAPLGERFQAQVQEAQQFENNELIRIQQTIGPKIQAATDEICKSQGWDLVVRREAVASTVSSGSRFNVTEDVVSLLNGAYRKDSPKKAK
jgi:Skp family chaperone for outer membrane proteins